MKWIPKAQVLLRAVTVYLIAAGVALGAAASEISEVAPPGWETAMAWVVRVGAWLATAVAVMRRVTEVTGELHGLTLPEGTVLKLTTKRPDGSQSTVTKAA